MSPDQAVVVATAGMCLIFLELNRPGRILPGAVGLLLTLFGVAALLKSGVEPWAGLLVLGGCGIFLLNLWRHLPLWLLAATLILAIASLRWLLPFGSPAHIHTPVAILCGGLLGALSATLTRIAYRARRSKALD